MAGLLYKEWLLQRKNLIILFISILFLSSMHFFVLAGDEIPLDLDMFSTLYGVFVCVMLFLITGMFQPGIFAVDESKIWANYITSSPLRVKGQVRSKYYFVLLMSIALLFWIMLWGYIFTAVSGVDMNLMGVSAALFYIQLTLRAFELPFIVRFGSKIGGTYKSMIGIAALFIVIVYLLFGNLSYFGSLEDFFAWLDNLLQNGFPDSMMLITSLFPYLAVLLYYLSYKISCKMYLKGVETYVK